MKTGFVFSDLHLFANRANAMVIDMLHRMVPSHTDYIVMNGDIFDFKWALFRNKADTLEQAKNWLLNLINQFENTKIYYIMGNHDCGQDWGNVLDTIQHPRFYWSPTHFMIDNRLFLHGDLPLGKTKDSPFVRQNPTSINYPLFYTTLDKVYNLIVETKIHRAVSQYFSPNRTVPAIHDVLERHHPDILKNIRHVYFGHTHHPFSSYEHKGKLFYNTGSAVRYLKFNPLEVIHEQE